MNESVAAHTRKARGQHVIFCLGETHFGVNILQMLRIVRLSTITRVPRAPSFLEGVFNYRGQVVPIVDLNKRLDLPLTEYDDRARVLIVELQSQPVGMIVDMVAGIWQLPVDAIQPAPDMVAQVNGVYLSGVVNTRNRLIVLLDLTRVLTTQEVTQLEVWQASEQEQD